MNPHDLNTDKELLQMWQESAFPPPADPADIARTIANTMHRFDRKIFWRNFREYAAGGVMLLVFAFSAAFGHRGIVPVPLAGVAAVSFVLGYMWWKHRNLPAPDPSDNARAFQAALLARFDRQIRLLRSARYWYFLPLYIWVLAATVVNALHRPARLTPLAHGIMLGVSPVVVTSLYLWLARLNERHAVRMLVEAKRHAETMLAEPDEQA